MQREHGILLKGQVCTYRPGIRYRPIASELLGRRWPKTREKNPIVSIPSFDPGPLRLGSATRILFSQP